ncbi:MAG: outer membrane beta-barrel protein [Janthinobacterium lividum]
MMTKTNTVALLAATFGAALCGLLGTSASAQSTTPAEKPITIKLGAFFPSSSNLKNAASDTWFSAGAEYAFKSGATQSIPSSVTPLAYVDYAGINRHGVNSNYVGVGPGFRYALTAPGTSTLNPYVGAGIGAYFVHAKGFGLSDNKTNFGYRLNAGVEFNQSYLFEINYTDPGSLTGTHFGGFNVQVGARF